MKKLNSYNDIPIFPIWYFIYLWLFKKIKILFSAAYFYLKTIFDAKNESSLHTYTVNVTHVREMETQLDIWI